MDSIKIGGNRNVFGINRMEQDFKKEARKQYFKYFRVWFIILGCLILVSAVMMGSKLLKKTDTTERRNHSVPPERVFDYADVLTDSEEVALGEYIAECEIKAQIDIVLVTISEDVEKNGYSWESAMMNYADDFYDHNNYGYNTVHGDGVLLLDNWYDNQEGSWLSTCGSVYERFGDYEIDSILDEVYYEVEDNPYKAYKAYVTMVTDYMNDASVSIPWFIVIFVPAIVALVYAFSHLHQKAAANTTTASTYVTGGKPEMRVKRDDFIRKNVVTRHIQTNSGGSSGRSGGGGGHRSSSGVSHGGGGRRR